MYQKKLFFLSNFIMVVQNLELVQNSLKWPKSHLSAICRRTGREYRTAIHPKSDLLSTTEDDREAVSNWTRHILSKLY